MSLPPVDKYALLAPTVLAPPRVIVKRLKIQFYLPIAYSVAQTGLELVILLPWLPKY